MIEARDLRKYYGSYEALKKISFRVEKGKVYSLLGSNGAGKTTIIKIITGLLKADSGTVFIDGKRSDSDKSIKSRFGYMPEHPDLYDRLTGREFLCMNGRLHKVKEKRLDKKINRLAGELNISEALDSEMGSYSKGMKQKILFINSVLHDPPNLILDEGGGHILKTKL